MIYTSDMAAKIAERPIYSLSAFVYKRGKTANASDVTGANCDIILNSDDFASNGNVIRFEGSGTLPMGQAVCKTCTLLLKESGKCTAADFAGAHLYLQITANPSSGTWAVPSSIYFVQSATAADGKITLECADAMSLADKKYVYDVEYTSHAGYSTTTIQDLFESVCEQCGVTAYDSSGVVDADGYAGIADNSITATYSWSTHNRLKNGSWTCRQVLRFIAEAIEANIVAKPDDLAYKVNTLLWYKPSESGSSYYIKKQQIKNAWFEFEAAGKSVEVTGVELAVKTNDKGVEIPPVTYTSATYSEGYIFDVSGNPLFEGASIALPQVCQQVYEILSALNFQNFRGTCLAYPVLEYGDAIQVISGSTGVGTWVTSCEWDVSGKTTIACEIDETETAESVYNGDESGGLSASKTAADRITNMGNDTSGWEYRQWVNGTAECWLTYDVNSLPCTTAVSSWYRTAEIKLPVYPVTFAAPPNINLYFETSSGTGALVWSAGTTADVNDKQQCHQFYLIRMSSSAAVSGKVHAYVRGEVNLNG